MGGLGIGRCWKIKDISGEGVEGTGDREIKKGFLEVISNKSSFPMYKH
ncbi:MAG: hypothetical protein QXE79_07195 [Candidatus Bathyarchaeia archaeon]